MQTTFHHVVSHLIHTGGYTLVDAFYDGAWTSPPAWPTPADPDAPGDINTGDKVVLRAPHAGLSLLKDVIEMELDVAAASIDVTYSRLGDGTSEVYDAVLHTYDGAAEQLGPDPHSFAVGDRVVVFSTQRSLVLAAVVIGANTVLGSSMGYLETMVLNADYPTPTLGSGPDPYPWYRVDLDNTLSLAPPTWLTHFGIGEIFDDLNVAADAHAVIASMSQAPSDTEMMRFPVSYGGGVPTHTLLKCTLLQDAADDFPRGTTPNLFITSREVPESVVRVGSTGEEYLVLATRVAVGPL